VRFAAAQLGITTSQFIREASVMRAMMVMRHGKAQAVLDAVEALYADPEVKRVARPEERDGEPW
jgi:hypothetical protein